MLERLRLADWGAVEHAYGPASDVPDMLEALVSPDADARGSALEDLFSSINHQGSVYPASALAVPFLCELALSENLPDRAYLLRLLAGIYPLPEHVAATHPHLADAAHQAIHRRRGAFLALAFGCSPGDSTLRAAAILFLAAWDPADTPADLFRALLRAADEPAPVRAAAAVALMTRPDRAAAVDALIQTAGDGPTEQIRLLSAYALLNRLGPRTPLAAVTLLSEALGDGWALENTLNERGPWDFISADEVLELLQDAGFAMAR
jgi:hypothetical protein